MLARPLSLSLSLSLSNSDGRLVWSGGEFDLVWVGLGSIRRSFFLSNGWGGPETTVVWVVSVKGFDLVWVGSDLEVWLWVRRFGSDLDAFVELDSNPVEPSSSSEAWLDSSSSLGQK